MKVEFSSIEELLEYFGDDFPDDLGDVFKDDEICWRCNCKTEYRQCKTICPNCGFTRDCSDP